VLATAKDALVHPLHGIFQGSKHEIIATLEQYARDRILAIEILASAKQRLRSPEFIDYSSAGVNNGTKWRMLTFLIRGRELNASFQYSIPDSILAPNPFDWYLNRQRISIFF
jgi:hypothetical protein